LGIQRSAPRGRKANYGTTNFNTFKNNTRQVPRIKHKKINIYDRPRSYAPLKAKDPESENELDVKISTELIDECFKYYALKYYELLHRCVHTTLLNPEAIFGGLRDYEIGGYCYTCQLSYAVTYDGNIIDPHERKVFLVYMTKSICVFDWTLEHEDPEMNGFPVGHATRFKREIWRRSRHG